MRRSLKPGGRVGIAVWAKGYARDIEQVLSEYLRRVDAKAPTYPSFGTRLEDLTGALSEAGFVSIRSQDRTLEIRLGGGVEELLEGWGAGPMRAELLALDPERAQQFRDCLFREMLRFSRDGALITSSVARLAVASAPTRA